MQLACLVPATDARAAGFIPAAPAGREAKKSPGAIFDVA
jgi:hypothetical protein